MIFPYILIRPTLFTFQRFMIIFMIFWTSFARIGYFIIVFSFFFLARNQVLLVALIACAIDQIKFEACEVATEACVVLKVTERFIKRTFRSVVFGS